MKKLLLLALALVFAALAVAPAFAFDDIAEAFGVTRESFAQAKIDQLAMERKAVLDYAGDLGGSPRDFSLSRLTGRTKTLTSAQNCVFSAVEARLGIDRFVENTQVPTILYASNVSGAQYQIAIKHYYPNENPTTKVENRYVPALAVIYLDDYAASYSGGATMDDALAGQIAKFLLFTQKGQSEGPALDARADEVRAWYRATYPSGTSSCAR